MDQENLSRRERRRIAKLERASDTEIKETSKKTNKLLLWGFLFLAIASVIYFIYRESTRPLPGEVAEDKGSEHVTDIAGAQYSSNPPSSGPHFTVWAKPGLYDRLISDGHLIHSMEHGYIIIWYDCTKTLVSNRWSLVKDVSAHDEPVKDSTDSGELLKHLKYQPEKGESWFTPENPPDIEVELPEEFKTDSCKNLVNRLSEFLKVRERAIVVPRLNMETPIALTAWGRILKLNSVDESTIKDFIKSFHNKGPEKTME